MISEKSGNGESKKGKRNQSELINEAERKFYSDSLIICAFQFSESNRKKFLSAGSVCHFNVVLWSVGSRVLSASEWKDWQHSMEAPDFHHYHSLRFRRDGSTIPSDSVGHKQQINGFRRSVCRRLEQKAISLPLRARSSFALCSPHVLDVSYFFTTPNRTGAILFSSIRRGYARTISSSLLSSKSNKL